jgi:K+/H+ antiporter YhaU regulatory subunit KhtT
MLYQLPIAGLENAELGKFWVESPDEVDEVLEQMSTLYERIEKLQQSFPERLADQVKKIQKHFAL